MWAAGNKPHRVRKAQGVLSSAASCGVTLPELLVVVSVMALATAGVSLAIRGGPAAQLEREAERLVVLLETGRAASLASGAPVRWVVTAEGFRFEGVAPASLPERWLAPGVGVSAGAGLALGPEPFIGEQQVQLMHVDAPGQTLRIRTDGLRSFAVQAGP